MQKKSKQKSNDELAKEILKNLFSSSNSLKTNQYIRGGHEIVTRCEGHARLNINEQEVRRTRQYSSGHYSRYPGANWTGILADLKDGRRYGADIDSEEDRNRLKTCLEGKCLFDLMGDSFRSDITDQNVLVEIYITYERPCHICTDAINVWIGQWARFANQLNVSVIGTRKTDF